jgi:hypothetical protein
MFRTELYIDGKWRGACDGSQLGLVGRIDHIKAPAIRTRTWSKLPVTALGTWLEQQLARVSAKSSIAEEIRYGVNHWVGLTRFLDDSRIQLDTNIVESGIRPIVLNPRTRCLPAITKGRGTGP